MVGRDRPDRADGAVVEVRGVTDAKPKSRKVAWVVLVVVMALAGGSLIFLSTRYTDWEPQHDGWVMTIPEFSKIRRQKLPWLPGPDTQVVGIGLQEYRALHERPTQ